MEVIKKFTLRINEKLLRQVEDIANSNRRSINSEIIVILEKFINSKLSNNNDNNK